MHPNDLPECFADHMGLYGMEEMRLRTLLTAIKAGMVKEQPVKDPDDDKRDLYKLAGSVAIVELSGGLTKKRSKFGGTSYVDARRAIRAAVEDSRARAICVRVESGGGMVRGVQELFDDINTLKARKPIVAYGEDIMASAAYYSVAGATAIYCNEAATVGSLGVIGVVYDYSGQMERDGVKVHVLSTSKLKAAGNPDVKQDKEMLASLGKEIDAAGAMFRKAITQGRGFEAAQTESVFTGEVWHGQEAVANGLVDAVMTWDDCIAMLNDGNILMSATAALTKNEAAKLAKIALDNDAALLADLRTSQSEESMETKTNTPGTANPAPAADTNKHQLAGPTGPVVVAKTQAEIDAEFDARVKAEAEKIAERNALAAAKETAATELADKYGKAINMTAADFKAKFESCATTAQVNTERKLVEATLRKVTGTNEATKPSAEMAAAGADLAAKHKALIAKKKELHPHDHIAAVQEARREDPSGFAAFMAEANPTLVR